MTESQTPTRRHPTIRIDTFRNRIAGTVGLLELVGEQLEDLHTLAYDRHRAGQHQRVAGGDPTAVGIDLDTHGDPAARELWRRSALKVLDSSEDMTVVLHEVLAYFAPGRHTTRRDATADATTAEVIDALAAARRRRQRGEYQAAALVDQPTVTEPESATHELDRLRTAVRKVAAQIDDVSRLTPAERDALRRALDPSFTRKRKKRSKAS